ncbi:uncharacterized protein [Chelonus insularis]|uniref:uncharacterized protein n=1 Tax=Chelonus insularis TaxID=460826 RepID=UPI001588AAC5|nr:uncharacterized protein LOC118074678 [Chelonus insularis]
MISHRFLIILIAIVCFLKGSKAIQCYQCSTDTDPKGEDLCGAYNGFDKERHIAIDCTNGDSKMPGSFCVKEVQQSARGFIWDGRWRQVIRRCASVADTGVTGVCNWGVNENGVFWQRCYCSQDQCNGATTLSSSLAITIFISIVIVSRYLLT